MSIVWPENEAVEIDDLLEAAEAYNALGLQLVPIENKTANVSAWQAQDFSLFEIESHLNRADDPGLGVKFGEQSNLIDLEYDTAAQFAKIKEICGGDIPTTWNFSSKHGGHFLFKYDSRFNGKNTIHIDAGDGTKLIARVGSGAYSAFPPSRNKIWVIGPGDCELASLPECAIEALLANKVEASTPLGFIASKSDVSAAVADMIARHPVPMKQNDGSRRLLAVGCRAVEHNLDDDEAIAAIHQYSEQCPFPRTYSDADIIKRLRDAEKKVIRGSVKPKIVVNGDFNQALKELEVALSRRGIFQRNGELVRIGNDQRIQPIHADALIAYACDAAEFVNAKGKRTNPTGLLLKALFRLGEYNRIRQLNGVSTTPILLSSGEIVTENGYNAESGYYVHLDGEYPGLMPTGAAVSMLKDLFRDFPFADPENDLAACIGYVLTRCCRTVVNGPVLGTLVHANRQGSGKGKIVAIGTALAEGKPPTVYSGWPKDEEMRKLLMAKARVGATDINFDNVGEGTKIGGPAIEAALTTASITDRILCHTTEITADFRAVVTITSNDATISKDIRRRCLVVELFTDNPKPHMRKDFKYPNLIGHILASRPGLVMAALSIVANHIKAGCPSSGLAPVGSFEEWSRIIRDAVIGAGLADPYANSIDDDETVYVDPAIYELHNKWPFEGPTRIQDAIESNRLLSVLSLAPEGKTSKQYLTALLKKAHGLEVNGRKFMHLGGNQPKWHLTNA